MKRRGIAQLSACGQAVSAVVLYAVSISGAHAADLGSACCADLEARISELEQTAAHSGNRKVSLTVSGQINKYLLSWDDGFERNTYGSDNRNDPSAIGFDGEAKISADVKAGSEILIRVPVDFSERVDQNTANGEGGFEVRLSNVWLESTALGKVTLGKAARVSDGGPETDLSQAEMVEYAGVHDPIGNFRLRRADGALTEVTWGRLIDDYNGDPANIVRYDTPSLAGFVASVSWGEDDVRDAGVTYSYDGHGLKFEGIITYAEVVVDGTDVASRVDEDTWVGSASILHEATGLNFSLAAGSRTFNLAAVDIDGVSRLPDDADFVYLKAGWLANLNTLGPTAFYGEYALFKDYISAGLEAGPLASLASGPAGCTVAGTACRATGSTADVWGVGVVQNVEAAGLQLYLGYRFHSADVDLVDRAGAAAGAVALEDFQTVISGAKISF